MEYIAYLHKEADSDFGVSFPDFPGCITAGETLEEARKLAPEALSLHIQGMLDDGDEIPEPSSLDVLQRDPALADAIAFLVSVEGPEKTVRVNITARESQLAEIDLRARQESMSRSAYMVKKALTHSEVVPLARSKKGASPNRVAVAAKSRGKKAVRRKTS